jgi:hypothetical protein
MSDRTPDDYVLTTIRQLLLQGTPVDIEGIGYFLLDGAGEVVFHRTDAVQVFVAYAFEDEEKARRLYSDLKGHGFTPWLDKENLMPGQNWPRAIERAIDSSDFFIACLSRRSLIKRGHFQSELRCALELTTHLPLDDIFVLPVRLDDCEVPRSLGRGTQIVDLFPNWDRGLRRIFRTLDTESKRRRRLLQLAG